MIDRKGITDRVILNGMTLMNWNAYPLPMNEEFINSLKENTDVTERPGVFFKGSYNFV